MSHSGKILLPQISFLLSFFSQFISLFFVLPFSFSAFSGHQKITKAPKLQAPKRLYFSSSSTYPALTVEKFVKKRTNLWNLWVSITLLAIGIISHSKSHIKAFFFFEWLDPGHHESMSSSHFCCISRTVLNLSCSKPAIVN